MTDRVKNRLLIEEMENRLLFSADTLVLTDNQQTAEAVAFMQDNAAIEMVIDTTSQSQATHLLQEVAFVDSHIDNYENLIADLKNNQDPNSKLEIFVLDSTQDGIDQISATLDNRNDINAVHIFSHGVNAGIQVGNAEINLQNLDSYAPALLTWQDALSDNADLLFYGCDLAQTEQGQIFLRSVSALTGADIAASTDLTGSEKLGGDWVLEYQTGTVEATLSFSLQTHNSWEGVLATTDFYLEGGGFGKTVPTSSLSTTAPIDPTLNNFDPPRDGEDGLLLVKGGVDETETDATKNQAWIIDKGGETINGTVTLDIWSALEGFDTAKNGSFTAYLIECDSDGSNCTTIGPTNGITISRGVWDAGATGTWVSDTFNFGTINHTVAAGKYFGVKVIVDNASGANMMLAYDSTVYSSKLTINGNFSPTAADNTVVGNEDNSYTFSAADFNYSDTDLDPFTQVQVTSLPGAGTLTLSGVAVTLNQVITIADINAGNLVFTPATNTVGSNYANFQFKVHDGTAFSAASYTMTIDVVNDVEEPIQNIGNVRQNQESKNESRNDNEYDDNKLADELIKDALTSNGDLAQVTIQTTILVAPVANHTSSTNTQLTTFKVDSATDQYNLENTQYIDMNKADNKGTQTVNNKESVKELAKKQKNFTISPIALNIIEQAYQDLSQNTPIEEFISKTIRVNLTIATISIGVTTAAWLTKSSSILASVFAASPVISSFDPLAIVTNNKAKLTAATNDKLDKMFEKNPPSSDG